MIQLTSISTYEVITERGRYAVGLERLTNAKEGTPRYKAILTTLEVIGEERKSNTFYSTTWAFKGHYYGDEEEARELVRQYEEILKDKGTY